MHMTTLQTTASPGGNPIAALQRYGQAIWLDFISRKMITSRQLARLVEDDGVAGVTSNPTIFEKAINGSDDYAAQIEEIRRETPELPARQLYERLVTKDIQDAADVLRGTYDRTRGADGFVSIEVSPGVANDTNATVAEARHLWEVVARPNVMIKVPGTAAGVPAVRALTAEGINVNITLLFGRGMYEAVAGAYIEGLEDRARLTDDNTAIDRIASVASFFVSRIDTAVDKLLDEKLAARDGRRAAAPGAAVRKDGDRERAARLPELQADLLGAALGSAGGAGRAPAAPAVGQHQRQEPTLSRRDVRR